MFRFCLVIFLLQLLTKAKAEGDRHRELFPCIGIEAPLANHVLIQSCDEQDCLIHNGYYHSITMGWTPQQNVAILKGSIKMYYLREDGRMNPVMSLAQPLGMDNLCEQVINGCPIIKGQAERKVRIFYAFALPEVLNGIPLRMELTLSSSVGKHIEACAGFNFTVYEDQ